MLTPPHNWIWYSVGSNMDAQRRSRCERSGSSTPQPCHLGQVLVCDFVISFLSEAHSILLIMSL